MSVRPTDIKVYNHHAALTVTPVQSRDQTPTVHLESALKLPGERAYDWPHKLIVQVTSDELTDVLATTLGWLRGCQFTHHGAERNKGYELRLDGSKLLIALFDPRSGRIEVAAAPSDRFRLAAALFRCLQRQHGGIAAEVLHAMLASIYQN